MADNPQSHMLELGIEFLAELLLFLYPYGADQMGLPHNFWLGLGCWIVGTVIAVRIFWIFPLWEKRLSSLAKGMISGGAIALLIWVLFKPVMVAYGKRNAGTDEKEYAQSPAPPPATPVVPKSESPNPAAPHSIRPSGVHRKTENQKNPSSPQTGIGANRKLLANKPPAGFIFENSPGNILNGNNVIQNSQNVKILSNVIPSDYNGHLADPEYVQQILIGPWKEHCEKVWASLTDAERDAKRSQFSSLESQIQSESGNADKVRPLIENLFSLAH